MDKKKNLYFENYDNHYSSNQLGISDCRRDLIFFLEKSILSERTHRFTPTQAIPVATGRKSK